MATTLSGAEAATQAGCDAAVLTKGFESAVARKAFYDALYRKQDAQQELGSLIRYVVRPMEGEADDLLVAREMRHQKGPMVVGERAVTRAEPFKAVSMGRLGDTPDIHFLFEDAPVEITPEEDMTERWLAWRTKFSIPATRSGDRNPPSLNWRLTVPVLALPQLDIVIQDVSGNPLSRIRGGIVNHQPAQEAPADEVDFWYPS